MSLSDAKIELSLQDAHRLVELVELGHFPAKAFENGRGTSYADFKRTVLETIGTGGNSSNVVGHK
ncbi:hypothetical protein [Flavobacterium sp.]|uniref:hypothetical protein n=1 Tax=Flavobacterium sp. TaxID=239 RepID=UPI0026266271|nr:hypothetical protein [Flavobacterium sp.]